MPNVLIMNTPKIVDKKVKVERDLYWYDHKNKRMEKFCGGKLNFEYKLDEDSNERRLMPVVDDLFEKKQESIIDPQQVDLWFEVFSNYNNTSITKISNTEKGILFDVPKEEMVNLTDQLDRENMKWEIDA